MPIIKDSLIIDPRKNALNIKNNILTTYLQKLNIFNLSLNKHLILIKEIKTYKLLSVFFLFVCNVSIRL